MGEFKLDWTAISLILCAIVGGFILTNYLSIKEKVGEVVAPLYAIVGAILCIVSITVSWILYPNVVNMIWAILGIGVAIIMLIIIGLLIIGFLAVHRSDKKKRNKDL